MYLRLLWNFVSYVHYLFLLHAHSITVAGKKHMYNNKVCLTNQVSAKVVMMVHPHAQPFYILVELIADREIFAINKFSSTIFAKHAKRLYTHVQ